MTEIAQLKTRVAELESRLAALEPKPAPAPASRQDEGARIFYPPDRHGFIEPNDAQLHQLLALVYAKHPALARRLDDSPGTFDSIKQCAFSLGCMKRTAEIDYGKSAGVWIGYVERILSDHRRSASHIHTATLCAGALCCCDIDIGFRWEANGFHDLIGLGFGLSLYTGAPTTNTWRHVLDGSAPLRSLVRPTTSSETRSPVRIYNVGV